MKKTKLNILYATPECVPFAHSGGLGEVAGSLPKALNRRRKTNIDCRVIMPLYGSIKNEYREKMRFLGAATASFTWRKQYLGLYELRMGGVTYYFVDNEYYFKRDRLYGHFDDGERFSFFSHAVFKALDLIDDFAPDVIHANDWQTALIPVLQQTVYRREFMKTVFTIHNIEYQGAYGANANDDFIGIPSDSLGLISFNNDINLMKGGIECCNILSTVSPSYSEELKYPENAFGLDEIIRSNAHKLIGILNGINTELYNSKKDPLIAANFSQEDLSGKAICKRSLQESLALKTSNTAPVITLCSRLVPAKGMDLVRMVMDDIIEYNDVQFILMGTGYYEYEEFFRGLEQRHRDKARCIIKFDPDFAHTLYAGGDMLLVPSLSEPCGLTQMIGCRYGDIPVVRATGGLRDSIKDATLGNGNGFVFDNYDADGLYHAIMNAVTRYGAVSDWQKLVKHAMSCDFGWTASAEEYRKMYVSLFDEKQ